MAMVYLVLIGLICLFFLSFGMLSMFKPDKMLKTFAIEPVGVAGLNSIRSVMGAFFLGCLVLLLYGLQSGDTQWYRAVVVLMVLAAAGRLAGIAMDGFSKQAVPPIIVELVIAAVLVGAELQIGVA